MAADVAREGSWAYSPNAGAAKLRQAIAELAGSRYDPRGEICVTAGTEEGLYAVFQAFLQPGDEVLVPDPGFVSYPVLAKLAGATPRPYPLDPDSWSVDLAALEKTWTPETRAIVVNSPSNPTGGVVDEESVAAVVDLARERGAIVISDEVYAEIYYGKRPPSFVGRGDHVVVLGGLSKSHGMTGLRIGWVLASAELMKTIVKAHQYIATCASVFSQDLALRVLSESDWNRRWLDAARAQMLHQRDAAVAGVRRSLHGPVAEPEGAFYLFLPIPECDSVGLAQALATEAAVLTVPGAAFGRRGEGFLRISFAVDVETIQSGISRIADYLSRPGQQR